MSKKGKPVSQSQVTMTELVLPTHTNSFGNVFGGVVMSWIDIAAAIAAQRHSAQPVVTASVDDLHFIAPIKLGWVVNLLASVNYVGKTSMEVGVRVNAENPRTGETFHSCSAYLTFVAVDPDTGAPQPIVPLQIETPEQQQRSDRAVIRRKQRLERRKLQISKG
jgi:acyl-CoA hydrolase